MPLTLAQLLGKPAFADGRDMDRADEIGRKATTSTTAIAAGRVAFHTNTTGVWAIATSGSTGRMGVVPALAPLNADADANLQLITTANAEIYVEANGTIKPGAPVIPDTGGKVKATTGGDGFAYYVGHYGEGSGLGSTANTAAITDALTGEAIRIRLIARIV